MTPTSCRGNLYTIRGRCARAIFDFFARQATNYSAGIAIALTFVRLCLSVCLSVCISCTTFCMLRQGLKPGSPNLVCIDPKAPYLMWLLLLIQKVKSQGRVTLSEWLSVVQMQRRLGFT